MRSLALDIGNPISNHPDNAGLALALIGHPCIPGVGGGSIRWPDLTRKTAGGTLVNGPTWVGTPFGQHGLSLTQSLSQYVDCGTVPDVFNKGVSLSVWVKPNTLAAASGYYQIISCRRGADNATPFALDIDNHISSYAVRFYINNGGFKIWMSANNALVANNWQYLEVSYLPGVGVSAFRNGVPLAMPQSTGSTSPAISYTANPLYVGAYLGITYLDKYWNGSVAGVAVRSIPATSSAYRFAINPATDPRLNRITGRTYYLPLSATPSVFAPAFGPGWGFAA